MNGDVLNKGIVWPGNPVPRDTNYGDLTIHGNYSDPVGRVVFNTFLGDDSTDTTRLVLDGGTTSGQSFVPVFRTGITGTGERQGGHSHHRGREWRHD